MSSNNSRRKYSKEFKMEAVQLALSKGDNASAVARDLGVDPGMLNRWIREYKADSQYAFPGLGKLREPDEQLRRLEKRAGRHKDGA